MPLYIQGSPVQSKHSCSHSVMVEIFPPSSIDMDVFNMITLDDFDLLDFHLWNLPASNILDYAKQHPQEVNHIVQHFYHIITSIEEINMPASWMHFNAIIGGSIALLPILTHNDEFESEGLDFYVPEHPAYELYLILLEETYFISETSSNMHLGNSCSSHPTNLPFHFPTHAQVLDLHCIIAGTMVPKFIEHNILDPLQLLFCRRYQERGFSFNDNLLAHVCTVDALFPHTSRHTIYPPILQDKQPKSLLHEGCDVHWSLGGGPCHNSGHSWMQQLIIIDASSPLS
ncbi:hypothetical protein K443DRAFT_135707 [Laccaria amethystina LaAM-08-1]|uniref:Uncharacterized protein n=1 Tax=Laccaria amethystina LaAM-08-1 TaxID=1095629 RepID=A0A0C9WWY3_9AGAR|nr:hypothetical protein K443DRAFT_135723 [Laccaria amethystina LaAM-08-1]KIJ90011.1 hypothetical protein K443DRAFT_135707 [Laccaria amethystina LaAM-08-1]